MFFSKILAFFAILIGDCKTFFKNYVEPALHVMETIKKILDNPELDFLAELSKTTKDEVLLGKIRNGLSFAIAELGAVCKCVDKPDLASQIECFIAFIKELPAALQNSFFHQAASLVANNIAAQDGVAMLPDHQIQTLVQIGYASLKNTGAVTNS
jgi:hypothetical protein